MSNSGTNITVLSLNPCIDWQYTVPKFDYGGLNRVRLTRTDTAGKGINVCIALKNLGLDPLCMGFNFAESGDQLREKLDSAGVRHDFVECQGAIRVNIKLYEESSGIMTELNQPGTLVSMQEMEELEGKISRLDNPGILVLSGSRPEGIPPEFYSKLCSSWPGLTYLDAEGEALKIALKDPFKAPYAIKPNLYELESTFGVRLPTPRDIAGFCRKKFFNQLEVQCLWSACVSMGAEGAVLITPTCSYYCPALDVPAKGIHGAGDAMVAGLIYAQITAQPEENLLPYAVAAAAASVMQEGTQMCTKEDFDIMCYNAHTKISILEGTNI